MDVLSDVLAATRLGGTVTARVSAVAPWGLAFEQMPMATFHTVTEGACWLRRPGARPLLMTAGDLTLLPVGGGHALSSDQTGPLLAYQDVAAAHSGTLQAEIDLPGDGPRTRLICGGYHFDAHATHPLLRLPPVLHLPAASPPVQGAGSRATSEDRDLAETLRMLTAELGAARPGSQTVVDRLVDVLFVHILRAWTTLNPEGGIPWLAALRDPEIAAAVSLMHQSPAIPWTIEDLARQVGLSRATLSRRFTRLVGEPPLAYLTRWRMELAARRLADTTDPLSAVAKKVGYTSEFAFSRAFSRHRGIAPSRHRAARRG